LEDIILKNKNNEKIYLTSPERETIISWSDDDEKIFIYSSQQPMIRKLRKNKLFELKEEHFNKSYACYPSPISVEGYIPKNALTIRAKITKRKLTEEQKKEVGERLKKGREPWKTPTERV